MLPASAHGYIFWSSYDSGKSKVGRAALDATGITPELVTVTLGGPGEVRTIDITPDNYRAFLTTSPTSAP